MRRSLPAIHVVLVLLALAPGRSLAFPHDHVHDDASLLAIEAAWRAGTLERDEAIVLAAQRVLAPETLPEAYRAETSRPVRCATPIVLAAQRARLDPVERARVDAWIEPMDLRRGTAYVTAQGRFRIEYETGGSSAVPLEDVAPANGIPDYVERVGQYLEQSWQTEFVDLGFVAPDISGGPYPIFLRNIGAYGFTSLTDVGTTGTSITMHHDFLDFPPNDDPEGNQWGAAKVTAAHELKHASQWANNGWTSSGLWLEVDATWVEDIVFDVVNDYYNYIAFRSPITDPERPLDDGGSGAYAEAIWQHWMSESFGIESILALWARRALQPTEPMLDSYDWTLEQFGAPLAERWVEFASWNLATGARALPGFGYEEAAAYPTAPLTDEETSVPTSFSGSVNRLAAHFLRATGFSTGQAGVVRVTPQIPDASPLRARVLVERLDGTATVEEVVLSNGVATELSTGLEDVAAITLVLAHGTLSQGPATYTVTVDEEIRRPAALPLFGDDAVRSRVATGGTSSRSITVENAGAEGSVLAYAAAIVPETVIAAIPARGIGGSTITADVADYTPGTKATLELEVVNRSVDFEWLKSIAIAFPEGVEVLAAGDFVAPEARRLVTDGATGDGVTVTWSDPDGAWGNVQNGEAAVATVEVAFDAALYGDLLVPYTLTGDGFGSGESVVESALLLQGPTSALVTVDVPSRLLAVGETADITWTAAIGGPVAIDLSRDAGATWTTLTTSTANDGSFAWTATGPATFAARVRVRDAADPATSGESTDFAVVPTVPWASIAPAEGNVAAGDAVTLDVDFDARDLDAGVYGAQLVLLYDGAEAPAVVPVELDVSSGGTSTPPTGDRNVVLGARPNPFNPTTNIELSLVRAADVRVEIFDARGRHVRTLTDGPRTAGDHAVPWDGFDTTGRRVASGVYLYVVDLDGARSVGKVSLVE